MKSRPLFAATLLGLSAAWAQAAFVQYEQTLAPAEVPYTTSLLLPRFDSALGSLSGVTLSFAASFAGEVGIFNSRLTPIAFTNAFSAVPVTIRSPDGSVLLSATAGGTVPSGIAEPGFNNYGGLTGVASATATFSPAMWLFYLGAGSGAAAFTAEAGSGIYGGTSAPGLFFGGTGQAGGLLRVRYDYDVAAVPLPPSAWLLGAGLVALWWARRRPTTATTTLKYSLT